MKIKDIEFRLKDGRRAVIRSPKQEDVPGMIEYLNISAGETEFIVRYPEECGVYTPEMEASFFESVNGSDSAALLICEVDGRIAGNSLIEWSKYLKIRHRGQVSIALVKEFWGQGIGTKMFEEMIRIGEEDPDLLQLELDYVEGNNRARALYEKLGFRIVGVRPNAIRLKDGTMLSEYSMIRELKKQ